MYKIFITFICLCPTFHNVSFAYAETSNQINSGFERKNLSSEVVAKNKINDRSMTDRPNPSNSIEKEEISQHTPLSGSEAKGIVGPRFVEPNKDLVCFFSALKFNWLYMERLTFTTMGISDCDKEKYYSIPDQGIMDSLKARFNPYYVNKEGIHLITGDFRAGVNAKFIYIGTVAIYPLEETKISWPRYFMNQLNRRYQGTPPFAPTAMAGIKHFNFVEGSNLILLKSPKKDLFLLTSYEYDLKKSLQNINEDLFKVISQSQPLEAGWSFHNVTLKKPMTIITSGPDHIVETVIDRYGNRYQKVTLALNKKILSEEINN